MPHAGDETLARALQALLDLAVKEDPPVRNGVLRVETGGWSWAGASGLADPDRGVAMRPEHQFQAGSITKMIPATTLMTLVEEGRAHQLSHRRTRVRLPKVSRQP